jgi:N-acetylmuramoyl-L-alanine amidase
MHRGASCGPTTEIAVPVANFVAKQSFPQERVGHTLMPLQMMAEPRLRLSRAASARAFASALLVVFSPFLAVCLRASTDQSEAAKRVSAEEQFQRAERMRGELEDTSEPKRTAEKYQGLITAYRRVYLITPRDKDVPTAMMIVGDLYRTMGRRFDPKYYRNAVDSYQLLLHEYPGSKYSEDALLSVAQIEQDNLKDLALAQKTYEAFLQMHPRSPRAVQAKLAISQIAAARKNPQLAADKKPAREAASNAGGSNAGTPPPAAVSKPANEAAANPVTKQAQNTSPAAASINPAQKMEAPTSNRPIALTAIKTWDTPDYTRVVIDLHGPVKYQGARVANPDRIYFDVSYAHVDHSLLRTPIQVQGGHVTSVRVAQNQENTVRVVLQVSHVKTYAVYLLRDPYRMVIDVYPDAGTLTATNQPDANKNATTPAMQPAPQVTAAPTPPAQPAPQVVNEKAAEQTAKTNVAPEHILNVAEQEKAADSAIAAAANAPKQDAPLPPPHSKKNPFQASGITASGRSSNATKSNSAQHSPASGDSTAKLTSPTEAQPNRDGGRSLTRALGLKIGRIVIDAGHGGHDTGTVGPTGLMEKDLCLDVAMRLGKMIEQSLPGAEVVYTRDDDTFIPLERRTEIANEAKADLFISIHANSSGDRAARGVETYYLNFNPSREAMEVAARENATAQQNIHDLDSLVQRIARNEKIEESKEFADDVQGALSKRLQRTSPAIRDRGVRKAPFVVLIGANMPSVLAEISFISNPTDEARLKKGENRQHVAEGLYKGMETYLHNLNSLANNQSKLTSAASRGSLPSAGNQR